MSNSLWGHKSLTHSSDSVSRPMLLNLYGDNASWILLNFKFSRSYHFLGTSTNSAIYIKSTARAFFLVPLILVVVALHNFYKLKLCATEFVLTPFTNLKISPLEAFCFQVMCYLSLCDIWSVCEKLYSCRICYKLYKFLTYFCALSQLLPRAWFSKIYKHIHHWRIKYTSDVCFYIC